MISLTNGVQLPVNAVKQTLQVAIDKFYASDVIRWVQYDETIPVVAVDLQYEDQHWSAPEGATLRVRMKKPDKHTVLDDVLGVDESGIVYFAATRQMTAAWGKGTVAIEVVASGTKSSANITVMIAENPVKDEDVQSSDEYKALDQILQEAQEAAKIVSDNAANLQLIADNLEAVQSAGENALKAEKAAEDAKVAAQQSLGFRTFFGVISPDESGNLDPSRPMTTPSAQPSWTIESKGDRVQSVQVNGIGGYNLTEIVLDGSQTFYTDVTLLPGFSRYRLSSSGYPAMKPKTIAYCTIFPCYNTNAYAANKGMGIYTAESKIFDIVVPTADFPNAETLKAFMLKQIENGTPVKFWYEPVDALHATGLYIPVQAKGHEYRSQCLPLTEALASGDNVKSAAKSGCDKAITLDGSTVQVTQSGSAYVVTAENTVAGGTSYANDLTNLSLLTGQVSIPAASFPDTVTSAQTANEWLQDNPQTVYYQSIFYTEQEDISVELETHANGNVYAHPAVDLVAVPYTDADSGHPAGTYDVSSQDGTTVSVSLKPMQDGGNAAMIAGHTWEDIQKLISDAVTSAVTLAQGGMA